MITMEQVRYQAEQSPPDWTWWEWKCLKCKHKNITMEDPANETEVVCEKCGGMFEPV